MSSFEEMNEEVLECARYGEEDELREYLTAGADVNYTDDSGNTALHKGILAPICTVVMWS